MRTALGRAGQGPALLDAEAVLLVHHGHGQRGELDVLLDQRVGADDELRLAVRDRVTCGGVLLGRKRAGEQDRCDAERRDEPVDRDKVLLSEGFRRNHERALMAVLDGAKKRVEGDDRLPRADVALEEPLHRCRAGEVAVELADRRALLRRQLERQRLDVARDQLAGLAQRGRGRRVVRLPPPARQPVEQDEELLEREPLVRGGDVVAVARAVVGEQRVAPQRQPLLGAHLGRERIGEPARERQRQLGQLAELRRRDRLAGAVDRDEPDGVQARPPPARGARP